MGMFDDIRYAAPCPFCAKTLTGWQSKDGGCGLQVLTPWELWEQKQHGDKIMLCNNCDDCGTWVEIHVRGGVLGFTDADYEQFNRTHRLERRRGPLPPDNAAGCLPGQTSRGRESR